MFPTGQLGIISSVVVAFFTAVEARVVPFIKGDEILDGVVTGTVTTSTCVVGCCVFLAVECFCVGG